MRRVVLTDELLERVYGDSRFRAAIDARPSSQWREQGSCSGVGDPDVFFPATPDSSDTARVVCCGCPVLGSCLAEALTRAEVEGVWGATTSAERRGMRAVWRHHHARTLASSVDGG